MPPAMTAVAASLVWSLDWAAAMVDDDDDDDDFIDDVVKPRISGWGGGWSPRSDLFWRSSSSNQSM